MLRRAAATKNSVGKTLFLINWFAGAYRIEDLHPLEAGFLRVKHRRDRRSGLPRENPILFYPRYWAETLRKQSQWAWLWLGRWKLYNEIKRDPKRREYMDLSLTPVEAGAEQELTMFQTVEAKAFIAQEKRFAAIRGEAKEEVAA